MSWLKVFINKRATGYNFYSLIFMFNAVESLQNKLVSATNSCSLTDFVFSPWLEVKTKKQQQRVINKMVFLLGFGCSSTSVCLKIFSVQFLVQSPLAIRFSRWVSNSVFSAWPSFSSVNWEEKKRNREIKPIGKLYLMQGYDDAMLWLETC